MIAFLTKIIMTILVMVILAEISRTLEHTDLPDDVSLTNVHDIKLGAGNIFDLVVYCVLVFNFVCCITR